jgi:Tfp pilus assembly protein PilX
MKQNLKLKNETGSVTVLAVVFLMLLTLLGMAALSTSSIETQIAGNEVRHDLAFYAAESAAGYVAWRTDLYGPANTTLNDPHYFPNSTTDAAYVQYTSFIEGSGNVDTTGTQTFNGQVTYTGSATPPRGSGYSAGTFRSHEYQMTCNGYSSNNASETLTIGFYRIGF